MSFLSHWMLAVTIKSRLCLKTRGTFDGQLLVTLDAFARRCVLAAVVQVLGNLGLGFELGGAVGAEEVDPLDVALQVVSSGRVFAAKVAREGDVVFRGFQGRLLLQHLDFLLGQPG